jgi:transcription elongation factor Elf1
MNILPCPCCGSEKITCRVAGNENFDPRVFIKCTNCQLTMSRAIEIGLPRWQAPDDFDWAAVAEEEAIAAWNRRIV